MARGGAASSASLTDYSSGGSNPKTRAELTALSAPVTGDFASPPSDGETGEVWLYDGSSWVVSCGWVDILDVDFTTAAALDIASGGDGAKTIDGNANWYAFATAGAGSEFAIVDGVGLRIDSTTSGGVGLQTPTLVSLDSNYDPDTYEVEAILRIASSQSFSTNSDYQALSATGAQGTPTGNVARMIAQQWRTGDGDVDCRTQTHFASAYSTAVVHDWKASNTADEVMVLRIAPGGGACALYSEATWSATPDVADLTPRGVVSHKATQTTGLEFESVTPVGWGGNPRIEISMEHQSGTFLILSLTVRIRYAGGTS